MLDNKIITRVVGPHSGIRAIDSSRVDVFRGETVHTGLNVSMRVPPRRRRLQAYGCKDQLSPAEDTGELHS